MEQVPHLVSSLPREAVTLSRSAWHVVSLIDGRRDMNTIVAESRLDRHQTVQTLRGLMEAALVAARQPRLELLGQKTAIALRGPIDVYNLAFLTSACTSDISSHLRVEGVEGEEVEVHLSAGIRERGDETCLVYFSEARTPLPVVRGMAPETCGYVLLVNVNSRDSVVVSRGDVALLQEIGDRPWVVALYASITDDKVGGSEARALLGLPASIPMVPCNIRDPADTGAVLEELMKLLP